MTTAGSKSTAQQAAAGETPWYELISDVPEPPEDAMQQADTILEVMSILRARYEGDPTTLVSGQSNVIYDSNTPGSVVEPDGWIVLGLNVDAETIVRERRSYRIDEWGVPPSFVMEVASESTAARDLGVKREIYARMGAQEYWRLDRYREYYGELLVGERLVDGEYVRLELRTEPDGAVWSRSEALGVDFFCRVEDGIGRFSLRDSATGEWLNNLSDEIAAHAETEASRQAAVAQASEARAEAANARAQSRAAEARAAAAEAEVERLRQQLAQQ